MTDPMLGLKAPYENTKLVEGEWPAALVVLHRDIEKVRAQLTANETFMFDAVMSALAVEVGADLHIDGNWESNDEGGSALYWQVYLWGEAPEGYDEEEALDPHPAIAGLDHIAAELMGRVWRKDGSHE